MKDKELAKLLGENKLDLSENGKHLTLEAAKKWVNEIQPLLHKMPDLYNKFEYYSIYVLKATRAEARIFNHIKTLQGIADQAQIAYEHGLAKNESKKPVYTVVFEHPIISATIAGVFVLVIWEIIGKYF